MSKLIFEKDFEVNTVNININKRLGLFGLLGFLQDIGLVHAENLGVGIEEMIKNNAFWVFTQHKLVMKKWPKWIDVVHVKTWPRKIEGIKAYRDFQIFVEDEQVGESVATFMVLDGTTRRPVKPNLDQSLFKDFSQESLDIIPEKIQTPENMEKDLSIVVRNSDLDMNNHVNNTKYSQWILDSIPIEYHRKYVVKEFDINFVAEARLGDEIDIFKNKEESSSEITSYYQGIRKSDQKVVFTSKVIGIEL
ncbi:MAG: thioesterase [Halobacteriovoraceae bacterium]|nr:thioesterase [Halobacteriovoraceae bacterium]